MSDTFCGVCLASHDLPEHYGPVNATFLVAHDEPRRIGWEFAVQMYCPCLALVDCERHGDVWMPVEEGWERWEYGYRCPTCIERECY